MYTTTFERTSSEFEGAKAPPPWLSLWTLT